MDHASLDKFVTRAQQTKRVGFGDLRRLKRALQADSIVTREQVEVLLSVDRDVTRSDPDWPGLLVSVIRTAITAGGSAPASISREVSEWLVAVLACARSKTAVPVARELIRVTTQVDETLLTFAKQRTRASGAAPLVPQPTEADAVPS